MQSKRIDYPSEYLNVRRNLLLACTMFLLSSYFLSKVTDGISLNGLHFDGFGIDTVRSILFVFATYEFVVFFVMGKNIRKNWLYGDSGMNSAFNQILEIQHKYRKIDIKNVDVSQDYIIEIISIFNQIKEENSQLNRKLLQEIININENAKKCLEIISKCDGFADKFSNFYKNIINVKNLSDENFDKYDKFKQDVYHLRDEIMIVMEAMNDFVNEDKYKFIRSVERIDVNAVVNLNENFKIAAKMKDVAEDTKSSLSQIRKTMSAINRDLKIEFRIFDTIPIFYYILSLAVFVYKISGVNFSE